MKKNYLPLLPLLLVALVFGCGKKSGEAVEIKNLVSYEDQVYKFSIKYPENWSVTKKTGERLSVFNSAQARTRFNRYDTEGFPGAKIDVYVLPMDSGATIDAMLKEAKVFSEDLYSTSNVTIDGVQGKKLSYAFDLEGGQFKGELFMATKDNKTATVLVMEAFDNLWDKYSDSFAEIAKSFKLATTPAGGAPKDTAVAAEPPSSTLVAKSGSGYSISIPENFSAQRGPTKGVIESKQFIGERRADCSIIVDVLDGSKTADVKKVADQNAAGKAVSSTKLGGVDAYMFSYQPTGTVRGRMYFAKKGDKIYRITMHWFTGEESDYLPVFEKAVRSIKFN
ncbi:MAG: PsbP-related protein [Chloroflexota bacterium]